MEVVTEQVLVDKIQRLERTNSSLYAELQEARKASLVDMLGPLRLRETVLLHVGADAERFLADLERDFGQDVARRVEYNLFNLNAAPVPQECRDAMSKAFNHGMDRWLHIAEQQNNAPLTNDLVDRESIDGALAREAAVWNRLGQRIPIFFWMLRVAFAPLVAGIGLVLAALSVIRSAGSFEAQPIVPIWLSYGAWPWYMLLTFGLACIFYSWAKARQWQTGNF